MESRYKSQLANRIAEKKPWSGRQLGVLVAAVAACALLVGAASFSIPIEANGSGNSPVNFEDIFVQKQDYLIPVEVEGEDGVVAVELQHTDGIWDGPYDVMKVSRLKMDTFQTPGLYAKTYTKFVYTVTVKLGSIENIEFTDGIGLIVAHVEITGVGAAQQYLNSGSLSINGELMDVPVNQYVTSNINLVGDELIDVLKFDVILPDMSYVAGDEISVFVMFMSALTDWAGEAFEDAFPEFGDYDVPMTDSVIEP